LLIAVTVMALVGAFVVWLSAGGGSAPSAALATPTPGDAAAIESARDEMPLAFEENRGQTDAQVDFMTRGPGYQAFLTPTESVLSLAGGPQAAEATPDVLRMQFIGADPKATATGQGEQAGKVNYLNGGADRGDDVTGVSTYERVMYSGVYPGIDLAYVGEGGQLRYDFIVAPGADPDVITLGFEGAESVALDDGELVVATAGGELRQAAPVLYQDVDGQRRPVDGEFVLSGEQVGFAVGDYDPAHPLVIDPTIGYSTYLGGSDRAQTGEGWGFGWGDDEVHDIVVDARGNAYVVGVTTSTDFPTTPGAFDRDCGTDGECNPRAFFRGKTPSSDYFVTKLEPPRRPGEPVRLGYSTYLGGEKFEAFSPSPTSTTAAIALDPRGNAYIVGSTKSEDFPVTPGAFMEARQPVFDAGFMTKLNPDGSELAYSTFLPGGVKDVTVDPNGIAYVLGDNRDPWTTPTPPDIVQGCPEGSCEGIYVAKVDPAGDGDSDLDYFLSLGAHGDANAIDVDKQGNAYITGSTSTRLEEARAFPVTEGAFQTEYTGRTSNRFTSNRMAFVAKIKPAGERSDLVYSTLLGGNGWDHGLDIAWNKARDTVFVVGRTHSWEHSEGMIAFPTTPGALQTEAGGQQATHGHRKSVMDGFLVELDPAGNGTDDLLYSTRMGGVWTEAARGVAATPQGTAWIAGTTGSLNFPHTTQDALQKECVCADHVGLQGRPAEGESAFVLNIDPTKDGGDGLRYGTFFGALGSYVSPRAVALDPRGSVYMAGSTFMLNREDAQQIPTKAAFQDTNPGVDGDRVSSGFVTRIDTVPRASRGREGPR
jgi:hypothetical protein